MSTQEVELAASSAAAPWHRLPSGAARWRALLEQQWRDRLLELTQLSVEFHEAGTDARRRRQPPKSLQQLRRRAVIARRRLADLDDALERLAAGQYGQCERCAGSIPAEHLATAPQDRYCARCA
jgi:RNA polymerase-binding transcription factor DksA